MVREYVKVSKDVEADRDITVDELLKDATVLVNKKPQVTIRRYAYTPTSSWNKLSSTHNLLNKDMVVCEPEEAFGEPAGKHYRTVKTIKH